MDRLPSCRLDRVHARHGRHLPDAGLPARPRPVQLAAHACRPLPVTRQFCGFPVTLLICSGDRVPDMATMSNENAGIANRTPRRAFKPTVKGFKSIDFAWSRPARKAGRIPAHDRHRMPIQRNLAIFATLALTGCGAMPNLSMPDVKARNDFKGKPLSAVTAQLG